MTSKYIIVCIDPNIISNLQDKLNMPLYSVITKKPGPLYTITFNTYDNHSEFSTTLYATVC